MVRTCAYERAYCMSGIVLTNLHISVAQACGRLRSQCTGGICYSPDCSSLMQVAQPLRGLQPAWLMQNDSALTQSKQRCTDPAKVADVSGCAFPLPQRSEVQSHCS